jgi:hypothetical protein
MQKPRDAGNSPLMAATPGICNLNEGGLLCQVAACEWRLVFASAAAIPVKLSES